MQLLRGSWRGTDSNLFPSFPTIHPSIRWTLRRAAGVIAVSDVALGSLTELTPHDLLLAAEATITARGGAVLGWVSSGGVTRAY